MCRFPDLLILRQKNLCWGASDKHCLLYDSFCIPGYVELNPVLWSLGCIQFRLCQRSLAWSLKFYFVPVCNWNFWLVLAYKWLATLPISGHLIWSIWVQIFPPALEWHSWGGTLAACYVHGMAWNLKSPSISSVRCRSLVECTLLVWCATWVGMN